MVALEPGIRVLVDSCAACSSAPRAVVNSGTEQVVYDPDVSVAYCPQAHVPIENWRELTTAEHVCLWAVDPLYTPGSWISIVRIPDVILAPFAVLGLVTLTCARDLGTLIRTDRYDAACATVKGYLLRFLRGETELVFGGVGASPPGLRTTTFDTSNNCYIGLHVDNWDRLPLAASAGATNRIAINLGTEDRYFVFINLGLQQIADRLDRAGSRRTAVAGEGSSIARAFMTAYPSYPIVKLRIAPGEAYIAPTENMVHDGCTVGKRHLDLHLSVRGHLCAGPTPPDSETS